MLSWLAADYFARSPLLLLPVFALVLFIAVFVGIAIATMRAPRRRTDRLAHLPLHDDDQGVRDE